MITQDPKQRLARMLYLSRYDGGLSQEKMALELGVAKKTVQNWEKGASAPSVLQVMDWFKVLNVKPLPFFLEYLFPDMEGIKAKDCDEKLRKSLYNLWATLPEESVRELLYLFYGDHGSSVNGVLQMVTAHLQTPLKDRLTHATLIEQNYEIAKARGELTNPEHIQPNTQVLTKAIEMGKKAIINDAEQYRLAEALNENK